MNVWFSTTNQLNTLIKHLRSNIKSISGTDVDRRTMEEAIAPCVNMGHDHPTLAAYLKKQPKTKEGFLASKATTELASELRSLTEAVDSAAKYPVLKGKLLSSLRRCLNARHVTENGYSVCEPEHIGITGAIVEWLNTQGSDAKTEASCVHLDSAGFIHQTQITLIWKQDGKDHQVALRLETDNDFHTTYVKDAVMTVNSVPVVFDENVLGANKRDLKFGLKDFLTENSIYELPREFHMPSADEVNLPVELLNLLDAQIKMSKI